MNFKKILISLSLATVLFLPVANVSAAIIDDTIINAANCSKENPCTLNTFLALGVSIANYILGIVGALTLLMFVFGGLVWILSGGSSDKVQKGKDIILGSVVGLVIVFSSYLIISFVSSTLGAQGVYKFTGKAPDDTLVAKTTSSECKKLGNNTGSCIKKGDACSGSRTPSDCPKDQECCFTDYVRPKTDCEKANGDCYAVSGGNTCSLENNLGEKDCGAGKICCLKNTVITCSQHNGGLDPTRWECISESSCGFCASKLGLPDCSSGDVCCDMICKRNHNSGN